ncbi:MAG: histidinol dehydrogenase, partial [Pseudomonadota bacterium]
MPTIITWAELTASEKIDALSRPAIKDNETLTNSVKNIVQRVIKENDDALYALAEQFDFIALQKIQLTEDEIKRGIDAVADETKSAIDLAYDNIYKFHYAQRPNDIKLTTKPGVICEQKHAAIKRVGLYIPGGTAPLPSTVLMLGTCAQVAGCDLPIMCSPANKDGTLAPEILYAATKCGIKHIYKVGGAQAIAAMAYGTASVPKVDKIFGPGNSYVTEAKQQVSQDVNGAAIDMPAGPSEVLVIADATANPAFVAADLLSQAEHGTDSQTILISDNLDIIEAVQREVDEQLSQLSRKDIAVQAINNSRFILCQNMSSCIDVSNAYAPEHLIVQIEDVDGWLDKLENAGSIFVGAYSPESAGDYASGTNHVLPTYGYARNYSSLGLLDFMRRYTVQTLDREGIQTIGPAIMRLADA